MTELEQLRKELNELRERVAKLEAKQRSYPPNYYLPYHPAPQPTWVEPNYFPPVTYPYIVGSIDGER